MEYPLFYYIRRVYQKRLQQTDKIIVHNYSLACEFVLSILTGGKGAIKIDDKIFVFYTNTQEKIKKFSIMVELIYFLVHNNT